MEKEQAKKAHDLFSEINKSKTLQRDFIEMNECQIYFKDNYLFMANVLQTFRAPLIEAMKTHIESLEKQLEQL